MTSTLTKTVVFGLLGFTAVVALADHGANPNFFAARVAQGLAPPSSPPDAQATIIYRSTWIGPDSGPHIGTKQATQRGAHVHYCVVPAIRVSAPQDSNMSKEDRRSRPRPWTLAFDLALVDTAGRPVEQAGSRVAMAVTVPVPIPAGTTRELVAHPGWCGQIDGVNAPPELYLQVEGRRARVIFDRPSPKASPR